MTTFSDAQIEAAAKAIHAASIQDGRYTFDWCNELQSYDRDYFRAQARAALEAAEALEEVEWAIISRQALIPAVSEGHAKWMLTDLRYNTGHVVRRRPAGPWIALEGETP